MTKLEIIQYSHNFSVKACTEDARRILLRFHRWFDEYEQIEMNGGWEDKFKQSFSYPQADVEEVNWNSNRTVFRFHINSLNHFKNLIAKEGINLDDVDHKVEPIYEPVAVRFDIKPHFKPFPEQEPIIPQICAETPISKLLPLQTGGGKSYLALVAANKWGYRSAGIMKPGYIDKWIVDIDKTLNIELENIITISGSTGGFLRFFRDLDDNRIDPHIILISNTCLRNWVAEQEKMREGELVPGYPCFPWEFFQYCGIGFRFIDEVHQDFHANFRFDLISHVEQSLSLSATLVTRNDYLKRMYAVAYPSSCWVEVPEYRVYARGLSYHYEFFQPERIKTTARGRKSYSHIEVEKSIMRSSVLTKHYYEMIYRIMQQSWLFNRNEGERCLVYFASKQMCADAVFFFKQKFPGMIINKFNQGDPMKNITESDLCFATIGKAGAAIDVASLTVIIRTVAMDTIQGLLQTLGRARDIRRLYNIDRDPYYIWLVCDDIEKQKRYHRANLEIIQHKLLSVRRQSHNVLLGYK